MVKIKYKEKTLARESFIKILYQHLLSKNAIKQVRKDFIDKRAYDHEYLSNLCIFYENNHIEIDKILRDIIKSPVNSLTIIDRCILSLSLIEFIYIDDLSKNVIINEAILLAKKYSSEDSYKFVNKILDRVK
ncbi:MAG: transcription antitermination factor NusB [Pseudomonadota bacterium]|nr:transcription antitermination factor NusB [Pseudomonadota bacterium]